VHRSPLDWPPHIVAAGVGPRSRSAVRTSDEQSVQVLQRGTMFAGRARRLYELYRANDSIESIPDDERGELESRVFQRAVSEAWKDCVRFFIERDPEQIRRAEDNPKRRMALIFRWYLGSSSGWSMQGTPERASDYQIWCGPAIGGFNQWAAGSYLATPANRSAVDVATHIMRGAAYSSRINQLRLAGVRLPADCTSYLPKSPLALDTEKTDGAGGVVENRLAAPMQRAGMPDLTVAEQFNGLAPPRARFTVPAREAFTRVGLTGRRE
jgi:hypothetical protein